MPSFDIQSPQAIRHRPYGFLFPTALHPGEVYGIVKTELAEKIPSPKGPLYENETDEKILGGPHLTQPDRADRLGGGEHVPERIHV